MNDKHKDISEKVYNEFGWLGNKGIPGQKAKLYEEVFELVQAVDDLIAAEHITEDLVDHVIEEGVDVINVTLTIVYGAIKSHANKHLGFDREYIARVFNKEQKKKFRRTSDRIDNGYYKGDR